MNDHTSGLERLIEPPDPPASWSGTPRQGKGWRRHSTRDIQRLRWRKLAEAEAQAATDAGEHDVARAFDAVLATLELTDGMPSRVEVKR